MRIKLIMLVILYFIFSSLAFGNIIEAEHGKAYFHIIRPSDYIVPPENSRVEFNIENFYIEEKFWKKGHGRRLLILVLKRAQEALERDESIECVALNAVRGSASFWLRMGFALDNKDENIRPGEFTDMHSMSIHRERLSEVIQMLEDEDIRLRELSYREAMNRIDIANGPFSSLNGRGCFLSASVAFLTVMMMFCYDFELPNVLGKGL